MLHYDPETGVFKKAGGGRDVGTPSNKGYLKIWVAGAKYFSHRLAWLYVHGEWPKDQLDHINGVRDDNRIANLREATLTENNQNRRVRKDSQSGILGVFKTTKHSRTYWRSQITANGVKIRLGSFKTADEASKAYLAAKRSLHISPRPAVDPAA